MALSLSANQKSILEIYQGEETFVIPDYQRSYSWGYDECYALYNDLMTAFKDNKREYFIGNLVMARYSSPKYERQIVDGQQRLTTLWLMLKVLTILCETVNTLRKTLSVDAREGDGVEVKVQPFTAQDKLIMHTILEMQLPDFQNTVGCSTLKDSDKDSKIFKSVTYLFEWLSYYAKNAGADKLKEFANYLLDNVYLLPIELYDDNKEAAQSKALTIFETINNRGLDLTNADIFRSKLYEKALFVHEQNEFVTQWAEFNETCISLGLSTDDVFRYYSHIIRGRNNITQMEINLRDFFVTESYSPLLNGSYATVMRELMKILDTILYIRHAMMTLGSESGKWFQVVDAFSNNYPMTALIVYLFVYGTVDESSLLRFTKSLIRYSYNYGSTRSVKFGIYNIIASVANKRVVDDNYIDWPSDFDYTSAGRIKEGFAKIAYYYDHDIIPNVSVDRWAGYKDSKLFTPQLSDAEVKILDSVGNFVLLDVARVNTEYSHRCAMYSKSNLSEIHNLFNNRLFFTYSDIEERDLELRKKIQKFMKGK